MPVVVLPRAPAAQAATARLAIRKPKENSGAFHEKKAANFKEGICMEENRD